MGGSISELTVSEVKDDEDSARGDDNDNDDELNRCEGKFCKYINIGIRKMTSFKCLFFYKS